MYIKIFSCIYHHIVFRLSSLFEHVNSPMKSPQRVDLLMSEIVVITVSYVNYERLVNSGQGYLRVRKPGYQYTLTTIRGANNLCKRRRRRVKVSRLLGGSRNSFGCDCRGNEDTRIEWRDGVRLDGAW